MKKMTARELKNETGQALQWAALGEKVLITRRGKPVAWLIQATETPEAIDPEAAWKDIEATIASQAPAFENWQSATDWSRGRV
ncbi:type II toxin-antitoxin system prevent-host-death family antitoxin [bacterium]|nr:type II toxin-antitoxin system prevent-host-death family antitoxin [bacterium]